MILLTISQGVYTLPVILFLMSMRKENITSNIAGDVHPSCDNISNIQKKVDITLNIAGGVYSLCNIIPHIQKGRRQYYSQYLRGWTLPVTLHLISSEWEDYITPNITGVLHPFEIFFLVSWLGEDDITPNVARSGHIPGDIVTNIQGVEDDITPSIAGVYTSLFILLTVSRRKDDNINVNIVGGVHPLCDIVSNIQRKRGWY